MQVKGCPPLGVWWEYPLPQLWWPQYARTVPTCRNSYARLYREWLAQPRDENSTPGFLHYFSKCCNFANLLSKTYLLSSADTAVHLSFSILYSTDPSITMGSTNQRTFLTSYTGSMIGLVVTILDIISTYSSKGNWPIVKAIPSSMVMSLSLAEKQRGFWQSRKEYLISNKLKSNTDQSIRTH